MWTPKYYNKYCIIKQFTKTKKNSIDLYSLGTFACFFKNTLESIKAGLLIQNKAIQLKALKYLALKKNNCQSLTKLLWTRIYRYSIQHLKKHFVIVQTALGETSTNFAQLPKQTHYSDRNKTPLLLGYLYIHTHTKYSYVYNGYLNNCLAI